MRFYLNVTAVVAPTMLAACGSHARGPAASSQPASSSAAPAHADPAHANRPSWSTCVVEGARRRAACTSADRGCSERTDLQNAPCYRAVYASKANSPNVEAAELGPGFAYRASVARHSADGSESYPQEGEPGYVRPRDFAAAICAKHFSDVPRVPCVDEIVFGVERLEWSGGFGAGP